MLVWSFIILSYASLFALGFSDNIRGPLFGDILGTFHLNNSLGAWIFGSTSIFGLLGSWLAPAWARKWSLIGVLRVGTILMALGLGGCAMAPNFPFFILSACIFGISIGSLGVMQNLLASLGAPAERREQILSGLHAMYGLSSVVAPLLVSALAREHLTWRWTYGIAAFLPLPVLAISYFLHDDKSQKLQRGFSNDLKEGGRENGWGMLYLALMMGFYVIAEIMVSSRLSLFMQLKYGLATEASSLYVMYFFVGLLSGRLLYTFFRVPFSVKGQMSVSLICSVVSILVGLSGNPLVLCLAGFTMAPFYPLAVSYIHQHFSKQMDAALSMMLSIAAILIVLMHLSTGILTDHFGLETALYLGPFFLVISFLMLSLHGSHFVKRFLYSTKMVCILGFVSLLWPVNGAWAKRPDFERKDIYTSKTQVVNFINSTTVRALATNSDWELGDVLAIQSQNSRKDIVGFVQLMGMENNEDGTFNLKLDLLRHSRFHFVQIGDRIINLDLTKDDPNYLGNTDLIVRRRSLGTSSRYKPLFLLGTVNGETAQNLWENEVLFSIYGLTEYGLQDWLTVGTLLPADFLGAPNLFVKFKMNETQSNILASGFMIAKDPAKTQSLINYNLYWDSISSESTIIHTLLSINLFTYDSAKESAPIQSLGTSSLQTSYEFILDRWNRFLVGPNFNVEKKSVGGFVGYVYIWDKFHLQFSLTTSNITSLKLATPDGYYPFIDAYWRF